MSTRQYIGARYVPKFYEGTNGSDWDSGVAYEPLTVVTYLGNSYTSKKPVPSGVGDPMHNSEYWASTGIYNTQVEEYREEVVELREELETTAMKIVKNRQCVFISDSYANRTDANGKTFFQLLRERYNFTSAYFNHAAGAAFYHVETDHTFQYLLDELNITDRTSISDIYIVGGANDINNTETNTTTAINTFMGYVGTNFPNATVHMIPVGIIFTNEGIANREISLACYHSTGLIVAPNAECTLENTDLLDSDRVHPTQTGVKEIYLQVCYYLENGCCNVHHKITPAIATIETTGATFDGQYVVSNAINTVDNGVHSLYADYMNPLFTGIASQALDLANNGQIRFVLNKGALVAPTTYRAQYGCIEDTVSHKTYKCVIIFVTSTSEIVVRVYMIDPIPASDNVTRIGLRASLTY